MTRCKDTYRDTYGFRGLDGILPARCTSKVYQY